MSGTRTSSSSQVSLGPSGRDPPPRGLAGSVKKQQRGSGCRGGTGLLSRPETRPGDPRCFCGSCSIRAVVSLLPRADDTMHSDNVSHQKTQPHVHSGGTASPGGAEETKDRESPAKRATQMGRHPSPRPPLSGNKQPNFPPGLVGLGGGEDEITHTHPQRIMASHLNN